MLTIEVDDEIDPTFDVPVRRGLGIRARRAGRSDAVIGPAPRAPCAPSGTAGSAPGLLGDRDLDLAMAFMTNGVRRDEAGAIARRDLSDAVRLIGK